MEPFFNARENPKGKGIRLIGVRIEKLVRQHEGGGLQEGMALEDTQTKLG